MKENKILACHLDLEKIWISIFEDCFRIGMKKYRNYETTILSIQQYKKCWKDFYYKDFNIDIEKVRILSKICVTSEDVILAKELIFNMINLKEDEFIEQSIRRLEAKT